MQTETVWLNAEKFSAIKGSLAALATMHSQTPSSVHSCRIAIPSALAK